MSMHVSTAVVIALGRCGMVSSRIKQAFRGRSAYGYIYASHVLGRRWPEGEKAVMTHPSWARYYAAYVIRGRWPEAEATIATDPAEWQRYLRHTQGAAHISFTLTVQGGAVVPPT